MIYSTIIDIVFFKGGFMLRMIITFLILAIIAGALGFSGIEGMSLDIARILFLVFLVLFALSIVTNVFRGKRPPIE